MRVELRVIRDDGSVAYEKSAPVNVPVQESHLSVDGDGVSLHTIAFLTQADGEPKGTKPVVK